MESTERTERLLILLLLQGLKTATQREKVLQLNAAGLANSEIAEYLGTTPQVVSQYLYEDRKKRPAGVAKTTRRRATSKSAT